MDLQLYWQIATLDDARRHISDSTETVKNGITRAVKGVVELGYTFRRVAENKLYADGGYATLQDFAKEEYGYSASQVSRFMELNEQYSAGGDSAELDMKWEGYTQTSLVEMLQLPENVREHLDPAMNRDEIRQLRKDMEEANEKAKEDAFVAAISGKEPEDILDANILDFARAQKIKERFEKIYAQLADPGTDNELIIAFTGSGFDVVTTRVATFFLKGNGVVRIMCGSQAKECSYRDLLEAIRRKRDIGGENIEEYFENLTGEKLHAEMVVANAENGALRDSEPENSEKEEKTPENSPEKMPVANAEKGALQDFEPEELKNEPESAAKPLFMPMGEGVEEAGENEPENAVENEQENMMENGHQNVPENETPEVLDTDDDEVKAAEPVKTICNAPGTWGYEIEADHEQKELRVKLGETVKTIADINYCPFCGVSL